MGERTLHQSDFVSYLKQLRDTSSRNAKKDIIRTISEADGAPAAIALLGGSTFDDIGIGKRTLLSAVESVYRPISGDPTVSESLATELDSIGADTPLSDVRDDLQRLADSSGNAMKRALRELVRRYAHPEIIAHACLDDWPTGVSEKTIANALGVRDSLPFYESVADIVAADDPITSPEVGSSFAPMLAVPESRGRPSGEVVAQRKVDGYRAIVHVSHDNVKAFSRRHNEITDSLPELEEIDWPDGKYIFDTEVIAETGSYSDTSERIGRVSETVDRSIDMTFQVFDMILDNGDDISDQPFHDRFDRLDQVIGQIVDDRMTVLPISNDITQAKDRAANSGEEGIIVKAVDAPYVFGKRSQYWQKVKMDSETIDVRITDITEGEGRLDGTMGTVTIESADGTPLGKCGTGFSDGMRDKIFNNQDEWIGRVIEIEGRGIGSQNNIRMPAFIRDRQDDGSPDSWTKIEEVMKDI